MRKIDPKTGRFVKGHCTSETHGQSRRWPLRSREHIIWVEMRQRCENPWHSSFFRYGARGIKVCERWQVFENFLQDMGRRPSPQHSIGRINNDGDYEPGNCRWETRTEQANNRRTNRLVTHCGTTKSLADWCRQLGLNYNRVKMRLNSGWSVEESFTQNKRKNQYV